MGDQDVILPLDAVVPWVEGIDLDIVVQVGMDRLETVGVIHIVRDLEVHIDGIQVEIEGGDEGVLVTVLIQVGALHRPEGEVGRGVGVLHLEE